MFLDMTSHMGSLRDCDQVNAQLCFNGLVSYVKTYTPHVMSRDSAETCVDCEVESHEAIL